MLTSLPFKYYKGTGNCHVYFWFCFLKHRLHKLYYCQYGGLEHPPVKYILESDVKLRMNSLYQGNMGTPKHYVLTSTSLGNEYSTSCFESVFRYSSPIQKGKIIPLTTMKHISMLLNLHFFVFYLISTCSFPTFSLHFLFCFLNTVLPAS